MLSNTTTGNADEFGVIHSSLEPLESLAQSEEKKEDKKEGASPNITKHTNVTKKAVVKQIWKYAAEGFGHAVDKLRDCTEEEMKAKEEE